MIDSPHHVVLPGFVQAQRLSPLYYPRRVRMRRRSCWMPMSPTLRSDIRCVKPTACAQRIANKQIYAFAGAVQ